jgi:ubiquinone/menaquinone biosynthesis C-methylase UbiE
MARSIKELVQEEFTRQAEAYASNPTVADAARVARLIAAVAPGQDSLVLDVATGPGFVALGFAEVSRLVIGVDLTEAPLRIAEERRAVSGLTNAGFVRGDADTLPFAASTFDVVVCRLAFHHLGDPVPVLREMVRVCRSGGSVAVEDLVVSEHPERTAFHNHFERLRDPSHTRGLPLSELLRLFAEVGLEVETVRTDPIAQQADQWLARAHTPPDRAAEVRRLLQRDAAEDLSGTNAHYRDGALHFVHRNAIVVGRKLGRRTATPDP